MILIGFYLKENIAHNGLKIILFMVIIMLIKHPGSDLPYTFVTLLKEDSKEKFANLKKKLKNTFKNYYRNIFI